METSLSNFELTESAIKSGSESSEQGSDKSETIEILGYGDTDQSSSNGTKSDEDFDNNLPETVTLLKDEATGAKVYLIGTVHFSKESQEDVIKVIRNVLPNVVVLELCLARSNILSLDENTVLEEAKNISFEKILGNIRTNGVYSGIMYLLLLNMSANLTKQFGMAPGGEFRVAYREAAKIPNCQIHLGDRPVHITLKRVLARLSWFQTVKLAWNLITSKETVSKEDIEKCRKGDMIEQLLAEICGEYPEIGEVFLNERDIFLTYSLQAAAIKAAEGRKSDEQVKVVGVTGIGHVSGIIKLWPTNQKEFARATLIIPPPTLTSKIIKLTFKITFISLGGYLIYRYVPVPKVFRENVPNLFQKFFTNIKAGSDQYLQENGSSFQ